METTGLYTYPDVMVICGEIHYADKRKDTATDPSVIIEVLSPSTEDYVRGKKFQHYRTIASLQEFLIIAQDSMYVEHYVRQEAHRWTLIEFTQSKQQIQLAAICCTLAMTAIYEKVDFTEE